MKTKNKDRFSQLVVRVDGSEIFCPHPRRFFSRTRGTLIVEMALFDGAGSVKERAMMVWLQVGVCRLYGYSLN